MTEAGSCLVRWWLVLAFGGCTEWFGVHETIEEASDADHDGVLDREDNCKGLANPDQADSDTDRLGDACDVLTCGPGLPSSNRDVDADGVDDACDPCTLGLNDDEDGDLVPDVCDACPALPGSQLDTDLDAVGDECDLSPTEQRRVRFDGFAGGDHGWLTGEWQLQSGAIVATTGSAVDVLDNAVVTVPGWYVQLGVVVPATAADGAGVLLRFGQVGAVAYLCEIRYSASASRFEVVASVYEPPPGSLAQTTSAPIAGSREVWLRARELAGTGNLACDVLDPNGATVQATISERVQLPNVVQLAVTDFAAPITAVEIVR